jgi:hypothetical protein
MTRRGLGRGRLLVGIGATVVLVAMVLPWLKVGGVLEGLTLEERNGFDGAGIGVFIPAVLLLAVLTLPYASRNERSALDRPITFLILAGVTVVAYVLRIVQLWGMSALALPDRVPGLWLGGVGVLLVAWGAAEILAEPSPSP